MIVSKHGLGFALPAGLALMIACPLGTLHAAETAPSGSSTQATSRHPVAASSTKTVAPAPEVDGANPDKVGDPAAATSSSATTARPASPFMAPEDRVEAATDLPAKSLEIQVVDANERRLPNVRIELVREKQSVSEGNESSSYSALSDKDGLVRFDKLGSGSDTRYRIVTVQGSVRYGTGSFAVRGDTGLRGKFHVYQTTPNLREALVAARTFLFIEPRDEVLQVEVVSELHNLGALVWVPSVELKLPGGWKAFSTNAVDPDLRVEKTERGVRLVGAVTPGQHSVAYSFQVPTENRSSIEWTQPLWPHTAETRVATVVRSGLELEVEGYPAAELVHGNNQRPMLMTGRSYGGEAKAPEQELRVGVRGLPVVGPGRWIAALIASVLVVAALAVAWSKRGPKALAAGELEGEARERLLEELARLTAARREGRIGEETFLDAQEALVSACVRLERQMATSEK